MFQLKSLAGIAAGITMSVAAGAASATVIDFTDSSTGHSGSLFGGSVTWTMTASGVLNNSQAFDGLTTPSVPGMSFETDGYGVGVKDDEITTKPTSQEWITVSFSAPVLIDALYFLDLFVAKDLSSYEVGVASVNGGNPIINMVATDLAGTGSGFVGATFAPILASYITFTVLSSNDAYGFADGALAGIGIAPIPVPAAGLLLLGGLGGLAAIRRRKRV